jgi:ATP-dependent helicase Lhr and Lhr-like helicase
MPANMLGCFSDEVSAWFRAQFAAPTTAQRLAWPIIASGQSLLLCTPTGSGKTLAGMLPIVDRIRTERRTGLQALYVAPLRALVQDTYVTLRRHGNDLSAAGVTLRLGVRNGDTSARVRQRQLADPPHILLTTPESLAVLLTHPCAGDLFRHVHWVVVDELHALAGNKRGADLTLSLERLERLAGRPGGLQRIGLSATCTPLSTAAQFLVGMGRPCQTIRVDDPSAMDLRVEPLAYESGAGFLERLLTRLEAELAVNRTTLIFTSTRNLTERITWALRQRHPDRAEEIAVHHSALAPARRRRAERAMKQGRLWAAISSTSLELGMDIGSVDGVVFVHPPGSIVSLLQRLGRSGHRPGALRRGLVLTASASALLEATVTEDCGRLGQIETLQVPEHPYDVLCQHLAGMAMTAAWTIEDAHALVRSAFPYRNLCAADFRACLDYLSGRAADGTLGLPARLRWEGEGFTIADGRTARLLRRNLGTILTEQSCAVRMAVPTPEQTDAAPKTALVGELDPLYAERLQPGDRFMLDGRCLEYRHRDGPALWVDEVVGRPQAPRWHGAGPAMSRELASRLYLFRVQAAEALCDHPARLDRLLRHEYRLSHAAVRDLSRYFTRQETISEIPDFGALLIERLANQACVEYYFHTPLPMPANDAIARVVSDRLHRSAGLIAVSMAADLGYILVLEGAHAIDPDTWRALLTPERFVEDFSRSLQQSSLLRERFAQVAQTGLLVLRNPPGSRSRVGHRKRNTDSLLERVRATAPDFLLLRQAEREASASACDLAAALAFVRRLPRLQVRQRWLAEPSPFADSLLARHAAPVDAPVPLDEGLERLQAELFRMQQV